MPTPKSKAARKAALLASQFAHAGFAQGGLVESASIPVIIGIRPDPGAFRFPIVHRYFTARAIANEAVGFVEYEVTAPMSLAAAQAPEPIGPKSVEYGVSHAVREDKNVRTPFSVKDNALYLQGLRVERERTDRERAENERIASATERGRLERFAARNQMGDFLDDDGSQDFD